MLTHHISLLPTLQVVMTVASQASAIFSASVIGFLADIAWIFPMKYSGTSVPHAGVLCAASCQSATNMISMPSIVAQIMSLNEFTGLVFNCSEQSIQSGACSVSPTLHHLASFCFPNLT